MHAHAIRSSAVACRVRHAAGLALPMLVLLGVDASAECPPPTSGCPTCSVAPTAVEGDPAPGTGAFYQSFDRPNLGAGGLVAFTANTDGPTGSDDVVVVGDMLMAREGDPAPGLSGLPLGSFEFFETAQQVNDLGEVVFIASLLDAPASADQALFRDNGLVAREGAAATGIPGRVFHGFSFAGLTDDGRVGFLADLDDPGVDDSVIYLDGTVLYREGDPVPGWPELTWDGNFDELQWNGRGDCLFEGNTSLPAAMDRVLLRRMTVDGAVVEEIVAQEGQPVATDAGTALLGGIQQSALAADGGWALRGTLADAPAESDSVVMAETGFVRREGEAVAELPGAVLGAFNGIAANARGDVAYVADLVGAVPPGVDEAIFLGCCLVVAEGDQAPGLPDGTFFTDFGFEDLQVDDDRRVVFQASYNGAVSGDGLFIVACPVCREDLDLDGHVEVDDLIAVIISWGAQGSGLPADLDGDGIVGVDDLAAVVLAWGACSS